MSVIQPNPVAGLVQEQIAYFRSRHFGRLRFPPSLEERFEVDTAAARAHRLWTEGWCMILCFVLILVGDFESMPHRIGSVLLLRGAVVLPLLLGASELVRRNPRRFVREGSIVVAAGAAICSSFVVYSHQPTVLAAAAQIGVIMALLVTNVVMRLRFPYAATSTAFAIVSNLVFLASDERLSRADKIGWGIPAVWAALFILLAAYSLEREERLAFVLNLRSEIQAEELAALNAELARLSALDPLTGLANRAGFDQRLQLLWDAAAGDRSPLSAVVIDVDHFKIVNDTQGHLYGDEVLKRVAALVNQSLRGKHDFAARFGGEEFIVLLPNTTQEAAVRIAERIRSLIQLAGSPAPVQHMPEPGLWTTVSCGVATVVDARLHTTRSLLHAADQALYAAKAAGRNRVCSASLPQLGSPTPTPTVTPVHPSLD